MWFEGKDEQMGQTPPFVCSVIDIFFYRAFTVMFLSHAFNYVHKCSTFVIKKTIKIHLNMYSSRILLISTAINAGIGLFRAVYTKPRIRACWAIVKGPPGVTLTILDVYPKY